MTRASLTGYAKAHGATRQAAAKWRASGALVMEGDQVDVEASDRLMKAAGLGRFNADRKAGTAPRNRPATGGVVAAAMASASGDDPPAPIPSDFGEGLLLDGNFLTKVAAEGIKENALALKHLLAVRKEAGQLLDADLVEQVVFEAARAARDAWLNFPTRVGPLMAADLGIEAGPLVEALTVHVQQQLEDIGEPALEFEGGQG